MNFDSYKVVYINPVGGSTTIPNTNNGTFTGSAVDFGAAKNQSARVIFYIAKLDVALTALRLEYSTDNSTWTTVPGSQFGVDTSVDGATSVLPSGSTNNGESWIWNVTQVLRRYYRIVAVVGAGVAGLYHIDIWTGENLTEGPRSDADTGAAGAIEGGRLYC